MFSPTGTYVGPRPICAESVSNWKASWDSASFSLRVDDDARIKDFFAAKQAGVVASDIQSSPYLESTIIHIRNLACFARYFTSNPSTALPSKSVSLLQPINYTSINKNADEVEFTKVYGQSGDEKKLKVRIEDRIVHANLYTRAGSTTTVNLGSALSIYWIHQHTPYEVYIRLQKSIE